MEPSTDAATSVALSEHGRVIASRFERFRTPANYAFYDALAEHMRPLVDHPCLPMYFEYAITTNDRGRAAASRIWHAVAPARRLRWWRRPRVLDVGCAYGGFLIAFGEKGARVTGIEIHEGLLRLAKVNLVENAVDASLVLGDATTPHPEFRGRFDLVLANDVVEHVRNLEAFLANLRSWLTPSGMAYLEIPNGASTAFVQKDGHHQLFGITQLDFPEASAYYERVYAKNAGYDTYNYLDLEGYRRLFRSCGLTLELLPETLAFVSPEAVLQQVQELEAGLDAGLATVPEPSRELVRERVTAYLARVKAAPRGSEEEQRQFLLDYGASFWIALAKPSK